MGSAFGGSAAVTGGAPSALGGAGATGGLGGAIAASGSSQMGAGGGNGSGGAPSVPIGNLGGSGGSVPTVGGSGGASALGGMVGSGGTSVPPDLSSFSTGERGCRNATGCEGTVVPGSAGTVLRQYWTGITANVDEISAFTPFTNAAFPNAPTGSGQLSSLQSVSWVDNTTTRNWANQFGERIRGFIKPPTTGDYVFWVGGDNECQFWLSTDESPANARLLAMIAPYSPVGDFTGEEQKSVPVRLEAGKLYYLDFFHRENLGDTHAVVQWSKPTESPLTAGEIVPGSALVTALPQ
ncbi:MAG: PA14 domain-containing protein [Polyangiaceae bacterium]|nr:PA14 domain-containing protein [Polyangiaceae bacterium]